MTISFRYAGQVGYLIAGMKDVVEAQVGDTLYLHDQPVEALPGFKTAKPMVFAGEVNKLLPKRGSIFKCPKCWLLEFKTSCNQN